MSKKQQLEQLFIDAWRNKANYIGIFVEMPGFEKPELIINHISNFKNKLEYYQEAYDENLVLKSNNKIRITDFSWEYDIKGFCL